MSGVRWNVEPTRVNCGLPDSRVKVGVGPVDVTAPSVHELEFDVCAAVVPHEPPKRSRCRMGLSTGLLNVKVNVCATLFMIKRSDGSPAGSRW